MPTLFDEIKKRNNMPPPPPLDKKQKTNPREGKLLGDVLGFPGNPNPKKKGALKKSTKRKKIKKTKKRKYKRKPHLKASMKRMRDDDRYGGKCKKWRKVECPGWPNPIKLCSEPALYREECEDYTGE